MFHDCVRCEKNIRKNARKVGFGKLNYIRTFLKTEHGFCDEELDSRSDTLLDSQVDDVLVL